MPSSDPKVTPPAQTGEQPVYTTTSVTVPQPLPKSPTDYSDWGNIWIVLVGLAAIVLFAGQIMGVVEKFVSFYERRRKKDKEDGAPLEARLVVVEEQIKNFRTREDMDERLLSVQKDHEHLKNNSKTIHDILDKRIDSVSKRSDDNKLSIIEIRGKVDSLAADFRRVEESIESLRERLDDRFDKLHEVVLNIRNNK